MPPVFGGRAFEWQLDHEGSNLVYSSIDELIARCATGKGVW